MHYNDGRPMKKTTLRDIARACNVSASTVSHALRGHLRVIDALTVAEVDPEWGMVPVSYVVTDTHDVDGGPLHAELLELVGDRLGRASIPRRIEFVDDLPLGHTGKPARPSAP